MSPELKQAITLIKSGQKEAGKEILLQILNEDEKNDTAWLWMTATVDTDELRLECLEEALRINPNNEKAQRGYQKITQRMQQQEDEALENVWHTAPEAVAQPTQWEEPTTPTKSGNEWSYYNYQQQPEPELREGAGSNTAVTNKSTQRNPLKSSPWITIFYAPRITITAILQSNNPDQHVFLIASLFGIVSGSGIVIAAGLSDSMIFLIGMIVLLIVGPVLSILGLYIASVIYSYLGFALGGEGSPSDIRVALAWSFVPRMALSILSIFQIYLLFEAMSLADFAAGTPEIPNSVNLLSCIQFPISLWILYIYLQCLGAAHRFSAWRALGTILMPGFLLFLFICMLSFLIGLTG